MITNEINTHLNERMINIFDNSILVFISELEKDARYSESHLITIHNAFSLIRFFFSKWIFINQFIEEKKLNFLHGKISNELADGKIFTNAEISVVIELINDILEQMAIICLEEESYEVYQNIQKYLKT